MGGRGSSSSSASDARFYANQRAGFARIAEQAEKGSSVRARETAEVARAAEAIVGTKRASDLLADADLARFRSLLDRAYRLDGAFTVGNIGDVSDLLHAEIGTQRPMGAGHSAEEWGAYQRQARDAFAALEGRGYSEAEVAAAVVYGRYIVRR